MTAALRRPTSVQVALWAIAALLAFATTAIAVLGIAGLMFEPQATTVDASRLPPGTEISIIDRPTGPVTLTACPPPLSRSGLERPWCDHQDAVTARMLLVLPLVALLGGLASIAAARRTWTCLKLRHAPAPPWPPEEYHQEGMPWAFWLSATLVGLMALLLAVVALGPLLDGDLGGRLAGPAFWITTFAVIVDRYGRKTAISLVTEGDDLVWRAPMRTTSIPVADIVGYTTGPGSPLGERRCMLELADGSSMAVSVPNRRHAVLLTGFLDALLGDRDLAGHMP